MISTEPVDMISEIAEAKLDSLTAIYAGISPEELEANHAKIDAAAHKANMEVISQIVSKYLQDPSSVTEDELLQIKQSGLLAQIGKLASVIEPEPVDITEEEVRQLKLAELSIQDMYCEVGRLEEEKMFMLERIGNLKAKKQEYMYSLATKYGVVGKDCYADLNTGQFKFRQKQSNDL